MASAEAGLADLCVFFIQTNLLFRGFPKGDQVQNLAGFILANLKDNRVQSVTYPADCEKLFRNIASSIEPIRLGEQLLRFLEPDAASRIGSEALALSKVKVEAHGMV
jgi:hypothetical protein